MEIGQPIERYFTSWHGFEAINHLVGNDGSFANTPAADKHFVWPRAEFYDTLGIVIKRGFFYLLGIHVTFFSAGLNHRV